MRTKAILEEMVENFAELMKYTHYKGSKTNQILSRINMNTIPGYFTIKLQDTKEKVKNVEAAREKCQNTFKEATVSLIADLATLATEARSHWDDISKYLKDNCEVRVLYPETGEIKSFSGR